MESEWKTSQFTVGQEIATFLVSCGLLPEVWEGSLHANNSEGFTLNEHGDFVCVAFASFQRVEDFIVNQSNCGEDNIQTVQNVFSECLKGDDGEPAFIHPGALMLFLHIIEKTDFQAKLQIYTDSKQRNLKPIKPIKPIIFVGHSIGGAIATLATLWVLGKRQSSPFCITFGCPLVGDERLVEAVGRENWGGNFCHVVSKHDIVPRMLLAPIESIANPLTTIFPYWQGINVPDSLIQDAARTLLNQIFVSPSSPYRPFGTYMLCSSNGAACIQKAHTVLEMLSLTMPSQQTSFDEIVQACLSEHIRYDSVLEEVLQNSIRGIRSIEKSNSESPYEMGILLQVEAIGVGAQNDHAQLALRKAGETEKWYNVDKLPIELSYNQKFMAELEWYKEGCEKHGGIGYYDTYKEQKEKRSIDANTRRVRLAKFWDDIIEMWENHALPSDFQSQNKWINAGTTYRKFLEPLDIAYYYHTNSNGNYLSDGRPKRHKVLQEWMEAKEKTRSSRGQRSRSKPASLTEDSCFWAYVEEARKDLENLKQGQHQSLQCLEEFEKYVTTMVKALSISSDVFLAGSSFMMWWEEWKVYNKNQSPDWSSPLCQRMENLSVSFEHSMTWSRASLKTYERDPWSPPSESSSPSNILTIGGFTVGQEIATFLVSSGLLPTVWEESLHANNSNSEGFTVNEHEDFVCVAFASFQRVEDFIFNQSKCGEDNIQTVQNVFSGCLNPALIDPGALTLFLHKMEKTDLQAKLQIYTDSKQRKLKPIIFVGHSIGGAIATLATLWVLEKRLRQISLFCITFGCPLVGNERLVEAVGRENWGGNFCHVVSKHDIVPRMLLAPIESIAKPFTTICSYWQGINVPDSLIQDAARTFLTLLNHALVSPSSPYRSFGTYMLCSSNGAACVENAKTVLEMLRLTMQSQQTPFEEIVEACVSEHRRYGSVLEEVMQNSIRGIRIANSSSESSYEMGISSQLEAIGVGAQNDFGQSVLRGAEVRNAYDQIDDSHLLVQLSHKKANFEELEFYKRFCEKNKGITYYDSFKYQDDRLSLNANFHRELLAAFWDEIVEMWESNELPSDFASQDKWINAGNTYRRLVEPLDIAHYYGMSNGKGNYCSDGRPRRHKVLQERMEAKEKTGSSRVQGRRTKPASLTQDSCFWARVEEALKDLESLKQGEKDRLKNLEKLENFEEYVTQMVKALSISSDVLWEGSSFMNWWKKWKEYNKAQSPEWSSPLYQIMESENPLKFGRIDSSTVAQEKISSTGEVKESIPSKGSDLAQLSSKESELIPQQGRMFELEWYKMICHDKGDGYYDSFKNRNDKDYGDSKTNLLRVTLNEFWDGIIRICSSPSLPSGFQSRNKWINVGTAYRKLVEPLDIAQYYSTSKDSGNYLDKRPARYKVLEQWLKHRKTNRSSIQSSRTKLPFLTRDSCFWARVEEALKNLKEGADQKKESLENFEKYVTEMINDCKISSDVLLEGSSFMKWWRDYKDYKEKQTSEWKLTSPLYKLESQCKL